MRLVPHLLILALVGCWFWPWWADGKVLAPLDLVRELMLPWADRTAVPTVHNHFVVDGVTQYLPYRWISAESLRREGMIGWNPLSYGGVAHYANTMALCFDWTVQLHRWLDFWTAWHLGLMGQFAIAGCGMLVLLRSQGLPIGPALFGAVAYAGNSQFVTWVFHRWALSSFCWLPLALWSLCSPTGSHRRATAPLWIALAFFGGSLQHAAFVVIAVGAVALAEAVSLRKNPHAALQSLVSRAGSGLLASGIAAAMFVPCIRAFFDNLASGAHGPGFGYPGGILQPVLNALAYPLFPFPWPLGQPSTLDLWKLFKSDLFYVPYLGFIPGLLGFVALFHREAPPAARWLMAAGLIVPLTPLVAPLYQRVFLVYLLGAAWGAAWMLNRFDDAALRRIARIAFAVTVVGVLLWAGASFAASGPVVSRAQAIATARLTRTDPTRAFPGHEAWISARVNRFFEQLPPWSPAHRGPVVLALAGVGLLLVACGSHRRRRAAAVALLTVVLAGELSLHRSRWLPWEPPEDSGSLYPETDLTRLLRAELGENGRLLQMRAGVFSSALYPNTASVFGVAAIGGYDSIRPLGIPGLYGNDPTPAVLRSLAVTHALVPATAPNPPGEWIEAGSANGHRLLRNVAPGPIYHALNTEGWPISEPCVERAAWNRRVLRLSPGTAAIRVAENWHPDWEGRLDGSPWRPAQPGKDRSLVWSLPEPASGQVRLELRFRPADRRWPGWVSLGSLTLALGLCLSRRPARPTPP